MAPMIFTTIPDGIVHKEQHDALEKAFRAEVDVCVAGGCEKIITFAGQRKGMTYEEGLDNCEVFLKRVKGYLEDKNITLCLENTNSKYPDNVLGRPDQLCDRAAWGFQLCKRVNSPRVKMCSTFITPRSRTEMSSRRSRTTSSGSRTSTRRACRGGTRSTTRRSSTIASWRRRSPT